MDVTVDILLIDILSVDVSGSFFIGLHFQGWLGGKKAKTDLPMEEVVLCMSRLGAPKTLLTSYLEFVDNLDKRLALAKKLQCHRSVIDVSATKQNSELKKKRCLKKIFGDLFFHFYIHGYKVIGSISILLKSRSFKKSFTRTVLPRIIS